MSTRRARPAPYTRPSAQPSDALASQRSRTIITIALASSTAVILIFILIFALTRGGTNNKPTAAPSGPLPGATVTAIPGLSAQPVPGIGILDPASGTVQRAAKTPTIGKPAPDFSWYSTTGRTSLSALKGHAVLLEFFGPWCKSCQQGSALLNYLQQTYALKGLQIVAVTGSPYGINYETAGNTAPVGVNDLLQYQQTYHTNYPLILDPTTRIFNLYGWGSTYPTFYIIDAKGIVRWGTSLAVNNETLETQVRAALIP